MGRVCQATGIDLFISRLAVSTVPLWIVVISFFARQIGFHVAAGFHFEV